MIGGVTRKIIYAKYHYKNITITTRYMLPHLPGVPHLHVNRPLDWLANNSARASRFFVHFFSITARLQLVKIAIISRTDRDELAR